MNREEKVDNVFTTIPKDTSNIDIPNLLLINIQMFISSNYQNSSKYLSQIKKVLLNSPQICEIPISETNLLFHLFQACHKSQDGRYPLITPTILSITKSIASIGAQFVNQFFENGFFNLVFDIFSSCEGELLSLPALECLNEYIPLYQPFEFTTDIMDKFFAGFPCLTSRSSLAVSCFLDIVIPKCQNEAIESITTMLIIFSEHQSDFRFFLPVFKHWIELNRQEEMLSILIDYNILSMVVERMESADENNYAAAVEFIRFLIPRFLCHPDFSSILSLSSLCSAIKIHINEEPTYLLLIDLVTNSILTPEWIAENNIMDSLYKNLFGGSASAKRGSLLFFDCIISQIGLSFISPEILDKYINSVSEFLEFDENEPINAALQSIFAILQNSTPETIQKLQENNDIFEELKLSSDPQISAIAGQIASILIS